MIISERSSRVELNHTPQEEVGIFVTRLWEHPLVNEQTRQHRAEGGRRITDLLKASHIQEPDYFAVPFGSTHRGVREDSDFDFFLFVRDKYRMERNLRFAQYLAPQRDIDLTVIDIEDFMYGRGSQRRFDARSEGANVLFTPDEYIGGDTELVQNVRFAMVASIQLFPYPHDSWRRIASVELGSQLKEAENAFDNKDNEESPKMLKRRQRLEEDLRKRATQSRNPELYVQRFLAARGKLQPPSLAVYRDAIRNTEGAVNIIPRYAAQGIK